MLEELEARLLNVLTDGKLARSILLNKVGGKSAEKRQAIKDLKEKGLVESTQPFSFGAGRWPEIFQITDEGRIALDEFK